MSEEGRGRSETAESRAKREVYRGFPYVSPVLTATSRLQQHRGGEQSRSPDDEVTSQQVLVCWKCALHTRTHTHTHTRALRRNVVFVAASHLRRRVYLRARDCMRWMGGGAGRLGRREVINKVKVMCNEIIKWHDAYPIESFRLKYMAVHSVQLPPSTCATSVDASFRKWNNINVTNDEKHHQLIDWLIDWSTILPRSNPDLIPRATMKLHYNAVFNTQLINGWYIIIRIAFR